MELIKKVSSFPELNSILFSVNPDAEVKVKNRPYLRITSLLQNKKILENMGIDILVLQDLNRDFSILQPDEFFTKYILEVLNTKVLTVGFNYRFCKDAAGDTLLLSKLCRKYGVVFNVVDAFMIGGHVVSSSSIKNFISFGKLDLAESFLGRPFTVMSEVTSGRGQGRLFGFPTANLKLEASMLLPPDGVYITKACVGEVRFDSITNVGGKPTFGDYTKSVEVHIIGFNGNIYGSMLEVEFYKQIRGVLRFSGIDSLKKQLEEDKAEAVKYFNQKESRLQI